MRLIRQQVTHFAGIASAEIKFGPGLNVLFGRNELGKSSLVEAIRAVLLMQHSSSHHQRFVNWESEELPSVELEFSTGAQRFWKVKKTFGKGSGAAATLDDSKDGITFSNIAKARQVDDELRKLLKWGIPEPGGDQKGKVRGMPDTFLTAVLLPQQDKVTDIFEKSLTADKADSARELLTAALQAIATDPLFAKVLTQSQSHFDQAFTTNGQKRSGKDSPFKQIGDEIKEARERLTQCEQEQARSNDVRHKIEQLHEQQLAAQEQFERARDEAAAARAYLHSTHELTVRWDAARQELARRKKLHAECDELAAREAKLGREVAAVEAELAKASDAVKAAQRAVDEAREAVQRASSEENAAQRRIQQQELENRLLQLEAEEQRASERATQAAAVQRQTADAARADAELSRLEGDVAKSREREQAASGECELLRALDVFLQLQETNRAIQQAQKAVDQISTVKADARFRQTELDNVQARLESVKLSGAEKLPQLKKLREDLRIAEARLDVGLSVEITPKKSLNVEVGRDKGRKAKQKLTEATTFEAQSLLKLSLDVAEIVIRGGKQDAREKSADLQARWDAEAEPLFEASRVKTLEEFESLCQSVAEDRDRARVLREDLARLEEKVASLGQPQRQLAELQTNAAAHEESLATHNRQTLRDQAKTLESQPEERRRSVVTKRLVEAQKRLDDARLQRTRSETQVEAARQNAAAAQASLAEAAAKFDAPAEQVLRESQAVVVRVQADRKSAKSQLQSLASSGNDAVARTQKLLADAERRCQMAVASREETERRRAAACDALNACQAEKKVRQEAAAAADVGQAQAAASTLETELRSVPAPARVLNEAELSAAELQVKRQADSLVQLTSQINKEEGALAHVAGDPGRQRQENYREALRQRQETEEELKLYFEGWRLLLESLRQAENDEAAHLGKAIMQPVADRFRQLTHGRYGDLELGPNLETSGIQASGEAREIDRLSVGTREQLSTIFRISLAEKLDSVLLLDDQLAQTDPQRMIWFRDLLRELAREKKLQIIVITCRPTDYLQPAELPTGNDAVADSEEGLVRAVNLERVVKHVTWSKVAT